MSVVRGKDAVLAAGQAQMVQRDVLRSGQLNNVIAVVEVVAIEERHTVGRPLDADPAPRGVEHRIADEIVSAGVNVDGIAGI